MHVLFVCSGNIFRSVTAEYILKNSTNRGSSVSVSSAGTIAVPLPGHVVHRTLPVKLGELGIDVTKHRPRKLTRSIVRGASLVISMGTDHADYLLQEFGIKSPLFLEVCYGERRSVLDIWEVVPNFENDEVAARAYVHLVVDQVLSAMPSFESNVFGFVQSGGSVDL